MRFLVTSAALLALSAAAPALAQPPTALGPIGVTGQVNEPANLGAPVPGPAKPADPSVIKDNRTLNPGSASVNASAKVFDSGATAQGSLAGGMTIQDMGGLTLGKVISVTKPGGGRVGTVVVQTADGVRRSMPAADLTVKGGVAVTSQSEADLVALPTAR